MALVLGNDEKDYAIKPEASTPALDTSTWPLLLKNYDKRKFFASYLPCLNYRIHPLTVSPNPQSSSEQVISHQSQQDVPLSSAISNPTYPQASSTLTNHPTLPAMKS